MAYRRGSVQYPYSIVARYGKNLFLSFQLQNIQDLQLHECTQRTVQSCSRPTLPLHHKGVLLLVSRVSWPLGQWDGIGIGTRCPRPHHINEERQRARQPALPR